MLKNLISITFPLGQICELLTILKVNFHYIENKNRNFCKYKSKSELDSIHMNANVNANTNSNFGENFSATKRS